MHKFQQRNAYGGRAASAAIGKKHALSRGQCRKMKRTLIRFEYPRIAEVPGLFEGLETKDAHFEPAPNSSSCEVPNPERDFWLRSETKQDPKKLFQPQPTLLQQRLRSNENMRYSDVSFLLNSLEVSAATMSSKFNSSDQSECDFLDSLLKFSHIV